MSVQSVERTFAILELLERNGGDVSLSELAGASDIPLPTIHRLLKTLVKLGYVRQLMNRRYALGARLVRLGEGATRQFGVIARPHLQSLVASLAETANFAVLDSDRVVYVAQAPSPHSMRMFIEVGRRAYLHATGVGKAVLSQLPDSSVRTLLSRTGLPSLTPQTIVDVDALIDELHEIRERGYAIDNGEQEVGVRCFAVPLMNVPTPAAVSVSGPLARVDDAFRERAIPYLMQTARALGEELLVH